MNFKLTNIAIGLVLTLTACTEPPASVSENPTRIAADDYFFLRLSQTTLANKLADRCPRYTFDTRNATLLMFDVARKTEEKRPFPKNRAIADELRAKGKREVARYETAYQNDNNLKMATTADFCKAADMEVARKSIMGQLLIRK